MKQRTEFIWMHCDHVSCRLHEKGSVKIACKCAQHKYRSHTAQKNTHTPSPHTKYINWFNGFFLRSIDTLSNSTTLARYRLLHHDDDDDVFFVRCFRSLTQSVSPAAHSLCLDRFLHQNHPNRIFYWNLRMRFHPSYSLLSPRALCQIDANERRKQKHKIAKKKDLE